MGPPTGSTPEKGSYLGTVVWLLFIGGNLILVSSLLYFVFYVPAFIASFIIAIILISRGSTASGVTLLLLTLIIPGVLWFGKLAYNVSTGLETINQEKHEQFSAKTREIQFRDVKTHSSGGFMYREGKVKNNGSHSYDFIKVKVEWLDKNGEVIDTDWTYTVGSEKLGLMNRSPLG